jgi:hypothetical protein
VRTQTDLRSVAGTERDQVFHDLAFWEGQDLLLYDIHLPSQSAQNQRKRTFSFKGNAVIPRQSQSVRCKLDVLLSPEPVDSSPEQIHMNTQNDFGYKDSIKVIQFVTFLKSIFHV